MALKYTGRSDVIAMPDGKVYVRDPKSFARNYPDKKYDGTFDKPIEGMTNEMALHLIKQSNMHSFEIVSSGEDLLEKETTPTPTPTSKEKGAN